MTWSAGWWRGGNLKTRCGGSWIPDTMHNGGGTAWDVGRHEAPSRSDGEFQAAVLATAIRRHAACRPHAPAFRFLGRRSAHSEPDLSWTELDQLGCRVAAPLMAGGLRGE